MKNLLDGFTLKALFASLVASMITVTSAYPAPLDIANMPLFLVNGLKPNVMVMLDNSGSMKNPMYGSYRQHSDFETSKSYFGVFDAAKNYAYNATIPVDTSAYRVNIDTSVNGAFVEASCTPGTVNNCWNGSYLNWLTTRRIDASRAVLIGGKLENRLGYDYLGVGGLQYKLVANNERSDRIFSATSSVSNSYSPIPNNAAVTISSPADAGLIQTQYDPYSKIIAGTLFYNSSQDVIGEFGKVQAEAKVDGSKRLKDDKWTTVELMGSYTVPPVVIAKPPSYNGADPATVRIKDVTTSSFKISMQEWPYDDGNHGMEEISYLVFKAGKHELPGGIKLEAGTTNTNNMYQTRCGSSSLSNFSTVSLLSSFSSTPVIIASVMSYNEADTVNVRVWDGSTLGFKLALLEQENGNGHSVETIGYVAIEPGQNVKLEAGFKSNVSNTTSTINFNKTFTQVPTFLAAMQTMNGSDSSGLRLTDLSKSSVQIFVEEEKSCDTEINHVNENIGYIAVQGTEYNIALVVPNEPTGLLQDVANQVRLGVSFYRYDPGVNDIYNGNTIQGGTMRFKIPHNPFVKKPTNTALPVNEQGYRELEAYIGTHIDDIIDALENYPLVWGTTPLAENLWEVIQYFEQDNPFYSDVISGFKNFDLANASFPERDPYYFPVFNAKMQCAKSNVLVFTDGFPFKDANIPSSIRDYDADGSTNDVTSTDPDTQGADNLDDVAYWGFCDTSKASGSCIDAGTGKALEGTRDLRADLSGDQLITIDTVGFADGNVRQILQDTANNAGGTAYAAEDGLALKSALTTVFDTITVGSFSSVSANSTRLGTDTSVFLAGFDSSDWSGVLNAYDIDSDGSVGSQQWAAGNLIPVHSTRNIISYDPTLTGSSKGISFFHGNLNITQQAYF